MRLCRSINAIQGYFGPATEILLIFLSLGKKLGKPGLAFAQFRNKHRQAIYPLGESVHPSVSNRISLSHLGRMSLGLLHGGEQYSFHSVQAIFGNGSHNVY